MGLILQPEHQCSEVPRDLLPLVNLGLVPALESPLVRHKGWEVSWALMGKGSPEEGQGPQDAKTRASMSGGQVVGRRCKNPWGGSNMCTCVQATGIGAMTCYIQSQAFSIAPVPSPTRTITALACGCVQTEARHIHCLPHQMGCECRGCLMAMVSAC